MADLNTTSPRYQDKIDRLVDMLQRAPLETVIEALERRNTPEIERTMLLTLHGLLTLPDDEAGALAEKWFEDAPSYDLTDRRLHAIWRVTDCAAESVHRTSCVQW